MTNTFRLTLAAGAAALTLGSAAGAIAQTTTATAPATTAQRPMTAPATTATGQTPAATPAPTGPNPAVGGAAMDETKPIVANAAMAPNLTTLVSAVKAAGLDTTLAGPGPFTVFAPSNDAFSRLAPGTLDNLMKPENKPTLVKLLTYHVVPGRITAEDIIARIKSGGGSTTLTTVEGEPITFRMVNGGLELTGMNGNHSYVETPDVRQSNGLVHVVNGVLVPTLAK